MLADAVAFYDRHAFAKTRLWAFKGLDAAHKLYESFDYGLSLKS